jgi:hypothetical protein
MQITQRMADERMPFSRESRIGDKTGGGRLFGRVVPRVRLGAALEQRLFDLFQGYYRHVDRATFHRDLMEKDWVVLLADASDAVQGFTSLQLSELVLDGRAVRTVFSGNTVIDRAYWGRQELMETWCRFVASLKAAQPQTPLYWFLICSGYRTYLYLPLFFHSFYPRHDERAPPFEQALIERLGSLKFPGEYQQGVVRVARPRECLLPELAVPPAHKLASPHVRFFVERNRGYLRGDELVCVAEFSLSNLRRRARQIASGAAPSLVASPSGE